MRSKLAVTSESTYLEALLLALSARSMHFALQAYWILASDAEETEWAPDVAPAPQGASGARPVPAGGAHSPLLALHGSLHSSPASTPGSPLLSPHGRLAPVAALPPLSRAASPTLSSHQPHPRSSPPPTPTALMPGSPPPAATLAGGTSPPSAAVVTLGGTGESLPPGHADPSAPIPPASAHPLPACPVPLVGDIAVSGHDDEAGTTGAGRAVPAVASAHASVSDEYVDVGAERGRCRAAMLKEKVGPKGKNACGWGQGLHFAVICCKECLSADFAHSPGLTFPHIWRYHQNHRRSPLRERGSTPGHLLSSSLPPSRAPPLSLRDFVALAFTRRCLSSLHLAGNRETI